MTNRRLNLRPTAIAIIALVISIAAVSGCRYDMQDQPRYRAYSESEFFSDNKAMRDLPEGTVARGNLRAEKGFYTGKKDDADPNIQVESTTDASGNTLVSSFPNDIEKIPFPVTREILEKGEERYRIFCIVCHGPVGSGDGMVVRRGYPQPPTYHDDRLRNAPDGHFFDVITNGWGKMNSYASQISPADRWAIVAYIRTLQISQDPDGTLAGGTSDAPADGEQTQQAPAPAAGSNNGGADE